MKERVLDELKRAFRPEFINRIDDIIVFHALSKEDITTIVRMMVARINTQLGEKSIQLEPTEAALDLLVEKGYDATYGARQLRRTIQKHVEDPLAEAIVRGQFGDGARIEVDARGRISSSARSRSWSPGWRWRNTEPRRHEPTILDDRSGEMRSLHFFCPAPGAQSRRLRKLPTAPPERQILVKEIAVQGNRRVQEAVILGRVTAKIGGPVRRQPHRRGHPRRSSPSASSTTSRSKVEDFEGGVKLTFVVTERPFVRDVALLGEQEAGRGHPARRRSTSSSAPCTTRSR